MVRKSPKSSKSKSRATKRRSSPKRTTRGKRVSTSKSTARRRRMSTRKLSKLELVDLLAEELTVKEVYEALIMVGKDKLAEEFKNEVMAINRYYDKLLAELKGKKAEEEEFLEKIVDKITNYLRELYKYEYKATKETEFHKQIEPFLAGAVIALKDILSKFGIEADVKREYKLPSGRRVDLVVMFGNIRIGIEVKMSLSKTSVAQRLLGQIDEYIDHCDALIVMSYNPIERWDVINKIKQKVDEKGKIIRIVDRYKTL